MSFIAQEYLIDIMFILGEHYRNPLLVTRINAERLPNRRHLQVFPFMKLGSFSNTSQIQYPKKLTSNRIVNDENEYLVLAGLQEYPINTKRQ